MKPTTDSLILLLALGARAAGAQSGASAGVTAGAAKLSATRSEQALTGIVQLQPRPWLTLSALPALVHVSDQVSGRTVTSSGPGDLPLVVGAAKAFRAAWSPSVGAALIVTLPVGDAACGLGAGETAVGANVAAGLSPSDRLHVWAGASRNVSGLATQSTLSAPRSTALRVDAGYDARRRSRASAPFAADVGQADSTQALSRMIAAAATYAIAGPPMEAFRGNIAAIHARDRAAYLSHYLHTPELARVAPDGLRQGYEEFARGAGDGWPDTLVATHLRIVPVSPDVAYGVYRYRVVDTSGSARGVSERVFVRTPAGWKGAGTTGFPPPGAPPPPTAFIGATLVDGTGGAPVRNAVVVMRDGRVACAGPRATCPVPADADTVTAAGKWIIPGLVDTHVHFSQTGWVDGRPDALDLRDQYPYDQVEAELHARPERFFRSYLCSGVTSVFDVGGYSWTLDLQARTAQSSTAPRVLSAGPLLSTIDFWLNLPDQRQFIYMADEATVRQAGRAPQTRGAPAAKPGG